MRSVADDLRRKHLDELKRLTPDGRVALALDLGESDLELFCSAQNLDREAAILLLRRRRQAGRQASRCMDDLLQ